MNSTGLLDQSGGASFLRKILRKSSCILLLVIVCVSSLMIYAEVYAQPCLPRIVKISNSYPESAIPNARVTITTNVDLECPSQGYNVTVDIMPTGYTRIISTASGPVAVNEVTTPTDLGPWSLDVVVKLVDYPLGRILNYSKDTIVIQIASSNATSTLTSASNLIELTTALSLES